jgi:ferric-dicitrate binding protein FerR (iron transport regulator)
MDYQASDYDQQIAAFLSGNSNPSEIQALQLCKDLSAENKKAFEEAVKVWENCPKPLSKAEIEQDKMAVKGLIITHSAIAQSKDRKLLKFLHFAAILIGPVLLAVGWYIGSNNRSTKALTWNSVTAPRKHIAILNMADGTEVWLNAGTTLTYPANELSGKREVKLSGEGYFKVTKNAEKPFFVITPNATVKVLGTSFNMKAYPEDDRIMTTLEEGSIEFFAPKTGSTPCTLHPGEQAIYQISEGKIRIDKVDASIYSAWKSEKFIFKDADLKTIIIELERLYDIKIHIKNPELAKLRFRGMFSYDQDLLDAFETLRQSVKLNYIIKGREVWLE